LTRFRSSSLRPSRLA